LRTAVADPPLAVVAVDFLVVDVVVFLFDESLEPPHAASAMTAAAPTATSP